MPGSQSKELLPGWPLELGRVQRASDRGNFRVQAAIRQGNRSGQQTGFRQVDRLPKIISETLIKDWYDCLNQYKLANPSSAPASYLLAVIVFH